MTMPQLPNVSIRTGAYRERWWHEMPLYTKDQMKAYGAACAAAEREDAAALCDFAGLHAAAEIIRARSKA